MAINAGEIITAARYNTLQNRVSQLLGTGLGDFGYGQTVTSSQVSAPSESTLADGDKITAQQLNNLRNDMNRAFLHQNGTEISIDTVQGFTPTDNNQQEVLGDVIGADQTARDVIFSSDGDLSGLSGINETNGFNDFSNIMSSLEANRFDIASDQQETEILASDRRTTSWNGTIVSQFDVIFQNGDARRHFFNAGGQIRIEGAVNAPASDNPRNIGWKDMIENPGRIEFGYNYTRIITSSTVITPNSNGNNGLTDNFLVIFKKDADAGLYSNSYWQVEARLNSQSSIAFRVVLVNDGPESNDDAGEIGSIEPGVTESVTADIEFDYEVRNTAGAVTLPLPAFQITDTFE